eukprot:scaffold113222_cov45-Phaeocystis_antarctica.AAC.1
MALAVEHATEGPPGMVRSMPLPGLGLGYRVRVRVGARVRAGARVKVRVRLDAVAVAVGGEVLMEDGAEVARLVSSE